jgi:tellurite methyltransferase
MCSRDATRWNKRYADEGVSWTDRAPRQLLLDNQSLLPRRGIALDAAAGVATNALFLAQRGLQVIALDVSEVGLRLGLRQARARNLSLEVAVCDLKMPWLPSAFFDVILNFRFLVRATFPVYRQALKPGGCLYFETYVKIQDNITHPDYYLNPGELRRYFQDWEVLHWNLASEESSTSHKSRTMEQLIVRKPISACANSSRA